MPENRDMIKVLNNIHQDITKTASKDLTVIEQIIHVLEILKKPVPEETAPAPLQSGQVE